MPKKILHEKRTLVKSHGGIFGYMESSFDQLAAPPITCPSQRTCGVKSIARFDLQRRQSVQLPPKVTVTIVIVAYRVPLHASLLSPIGGPDCQKNHL